MKKAHISQTKKGYKVDETRKLRDYVDLTDLEYYEKIMMSSTPPEGSELRKLRDLTVGLPSLSIKPSTRGILKGAALRSKPNLEARAKHATSFKSRRKTTSVETDLSSTPKNPQPPSTLHALGLTQNQWEHLEGTKTLKDVEIEIYTDTGIASRESLPRFLFRAFGSRSGGGVNHRLNTTSGIIPHGFLGGKKPTSIYDIPDLRSMITGHLTGASVDTHFSSWAACICLALDCAHDSMYIAILDTTLLPNQPHIYHVPDLFSAGLSSDRYDHEYLAYGPIDGPAFYCVPGQALYSSGFDRFYSSGFDRFYISPYHRRIYPVDNNIARNVILAKQMAALFRPSHDKRPDIIIALTVAFASITHTRRYGNGPATELDRKLLGQVLVHLASEIEDLRLASSRSATPAPALVNPRMYTKDYPQLQKMVLLLQKVEEKIRQG